MNFGYSSKDLEISLSPVHEQNRYSIQLYHQIVNKVGVEGKEILEVGCGRGGGLAYVFEKFSPRSATGVDLNPEAINFCNNHHRKEGMNFVVGNAEELPFDDNSQDIVINVESSHIYGSMENFLAEVKRVLRPGGHFLISDFRQAHKLPELRNSIKNSKLSQLIEENITPEVIHALEKDDYRKRKLIKKIIPWFLHKAAMNFGAVKGSKKYNNFVEGRIHYFNYVFQKSHHPD